MRLLAAGARGGMVTLGAVRRPRPAVIVAGLRGPAGAGGVASFNGRLGNVTLTGADVTTALGYTPQDGGSLSAVAFSGAYADLLGAPLIPSTPADIGAATAAQGALAASAVQPDTLDTALALKVDKVAGYGLSQENYTAAEKIKLAGLEGSHFKGLFASLAALELAFPSAVAGDYADVDAGIGSDTVRHLWDVDDAQWIAGGSGSPLTAADIKTLYESNPDTNAYTDAEQTKLGGIEAGAQVNAAAVSQAEAEAGTGTALRSWTVQRVWQAIAAWWAASAMKTKLDGIATNATANSTDVELRDRSTHTGTQTASTISDFNAAASAAAPVQSVNSQTGTVVLDAGDVGADAAGTAASAVVAHEALADPHPQYLTQTEGDARYERGLTAGTNITIDRTDPDNPVINASGGGGGAVDSVNSQTGVVVLDAGDVGAEYPLTAGANITINRTDPGNPVISATGGTGIEPESIEASEALSAGHYVNLFNDGGTLKARKAGGSGKYPAHGFVKAAVSAAATAEVYPLAANNDALSGLSIGVTCYLSTSTAGAVQLTAPNSSGVLRQELGVAISATEILHTNSIPVELV
ncbi:hypothetical protein ACF8C6_09075 [Pseudomonas sp. zbq_18]|uniref:hypothetical protein n=1 Tax=Pseudomonas sp. zbq_18 TaxID=3367251 RepID=UPI00370AA01B